MCINWEGGGGGGGIASSPTGKTKELLPLGANSGNKL